MPLGRHRKPFSNKQKKEQLQAKRERKRNKGFYRYLWLFILLFWTLYFRIVFYSKEEEDANDSSGSSAGNERKERRAAKKIINLQPNKNEKSYNPNKLLWIFRFQMTWVSFKSGLSLFFDFKVQSALSQRDARGSQASQERCVKGAAHTARDRHGGGHGEHLQAFESTRHASAARVDLWHRKGAIGETRNRVLCG